MQLRRVREGTQIEEDHMRNRQMIVRWLMAQHRRRSTCGTRDGKTYYVDGRSRRRSSDGVGRLLAEVQRIKAEGDYAAAKALFETYGVHFDPKLRDEVVARVDQPAAAVLHRLRACRSSSRSRDADGEITDVKISYPLDLTTQMLEYSGRRE